jgi:enterobactin synthetase component D
MHQPTPQTPEMIVAQFWLELDLPVANLPPALVVEFDEVYFDASLSARFGVTMPQSIINSVSRRQAEFFAGRWASRRAIQRLGRVAEDIGIGPSRAPRWPIGLIGSISHSGSIAAAIVAMRGTCTGIGIDIERTVDADTGSTLFPHVVNSQEIEVLTRAGLPWRTALTLAFSVKESFFKGTHASVGYFFDFDAVRVIGADTVRRRIDVVLDVTLSPLLSRGHVFQLNYFYLHDDIVLTSFAW